VATADPIIQRTCLRLSGAGGPTGFARSARTRAVCTDLFRHARTCSRVRSTLNDSTHLHPAWSVSRDRPREAVASRRPRRARRERPDARPPTLPGGGSEPRQVMGRGESLALFLKSEAPARCRSRPIRARRTYRPGCHGALFP